MTIAGKGQNGFYGERIALFIAALLLGNVQLRSRLKRLTLKQSSVGQQLAPVGWRL